MTSWTDVFRHQYINFYILSSSLFQSFRSASISNDINGAGTRKLLVIMIEGLRWDHIDGLRGLERLAENGVLANYLQPIFPTNSFPNMYSFATGK